MANINVRYSVTISDDTVVQNELKWLVDNEIDPDNAGGNYPARFRLAFKKFGTDAMREKLLDRRRELIKGTKSNEAQTEIDNINPKADISDGVDN